MKVEKLTQVVDGRLSTLNLDQIVNHATVVTNRVCEQSLFISSNSSHIDSAIKRGAKTVIYDSDLVDTSNKDISWIRVERLDVAAFKLLEYVKGEDDVSFYYLTNRQLDFLKMITLYKRDIEYLEGDWRKIFEIVLNSKKKIFISSDLNIIERISKDYLKLEREADGYIISDTLFRTTFRVGKYVYQHKEFSPIYFDTLLKVIAFCEDNNQEYLLDKLRHLKGFKPIYLEGEPILNALIRDNRVVIIADSLEDILDAINYLKKPTKWVIKSVVLTPPKTKLDAIQKPVYYYNNEDIIDTINQSHYNFIFILTSDLKIENIIKREFNI